MTDREQLLVELVDERGAAVGACSVAEAHTEPGRLHRAFSVLLRDDTGRVLLQRRAATKTRFASRWSNTCCGHPAPGADVAAEAVARLSAELGVAPEGALTEAGSFSYRSGDQASGRVEFEWDHVLIGRYNGDVSAADPGEVSECRWVSVADLRTAMAANPYAYSPWLADVLRLAAVN